MKKLNYLFLLLCLGVWISCDSLEEETVMEDNIPLANGKDAIGALDASSLDPINEECGEEGVTELIAGQFTDVGEVIVSYDGTILTVEYVVDAEGVNLTDTHLHLTSCDNFEGFPMKNGNPPPGQFDFQGENPFEIDLAAEGLDFECLLIAAHGVVETPDGDEVDLEFFAECLPEGLVKYEVLQNRPDGDPSYFTANLPGQNLFGIPAWCLDVDHNIGGYPDFAMYMMEMISSYSDDAATIECLVDKPENLDVVNWLCNQDLSQYSGAEIQGALWTLVDDNPHVNSGGGISWDQTTVDALVALALQNGEGFVPGCDDKVVVLMDPGCPEDPDHSHLQTTFVCLPNKCKGEDTVWGEGAEFPGNNWAMYFKYCVEE